MRGPNPGSNHPTLHLLEKCKRLENLRQAHAHMITTGLILHTYPLSRILLISSTIAIAHALSIFNHIPNPSIFLCNTLISSLSNHKSHIHLAFSLYSRVLTHTTLKPNAFTFPSLLKACGFQPWIPYGRVLHTHVVKFLQPASDPFVQAALLNYYAKCGNVGTCRYLFNQIREPDLASWNSILSAYSRNSGAVCEDASLSLEVLSLFIEMQKSLVKANEVTLVALISACAELGALSQGAWAHVYALKHNLELNHFVGTALIEMYSKCGCLDIAYQLFDQLPQRDTLCYNAMIGGFAIHGCGDRGLELFKKMTLEGLAPDVVTLVVTMCGCSHVGLVEEGCKVFESIKEVYGIEPTIEHYGCLVDLLGRAGRLREAEEKVLNMPMKPNAVIWRSLLGSARVHGSLETAEIAIEHLMEVEPETSGNYVLLSNMYASFKRWDDVKRVRKLMKDHGVNKQPGRSLVEVGGAMHEFLTGDKTHPRSEEIYLKLEEMNRRLHEHGYKPRTLEVLFDIEEEEKEDALSYHSERLTLAFALIASHHHRPCGPIRITKNLRVCGDCHASGKLISKTYEREIIIRDRNRFHHFKEGACSCSDYW